MAEIKEPSDAEPVELPALTPSIDKERLAKFLEKLPSPEETEMQRLMSQVKAIRLQGIILGMHFHGSDLLWFQPGKMDETEFNELKNEFEDELSIIDARHQKRESSGASAWEGMGTRTDIDNRGDSEDADRSRSIKFRMFPRTFINRLAAMKDRLIEARRENCITIQMYQSGRHKECIYILPYAKAPMMMQLFNDVNRELDQLNEDIQAYIAGAEYEKLRSILKHYHSALDKKTWNIPHVDRELIPLELNPTRVMEMVKSRGQTLTEKQDLEFKARYEEGERLLEAELESKSRQLVTGALEALKKELDDNVAPIVAKMVTDPERVKRNIANLKDKAASIGLEALANTVTDPLEKLIDDPDRADELFGVSILSQVPDSIDERFKALLRNLGAGAEAKKE
jgi:hypothetical protein